MNYPHPMDDKTGFEATDEEMGLPLTECDCCGKARVLSRCWTTDGIETFACDECRGNGDRDTRATGTAGA